VSRLAWIVVVAALAGAAGSAFAAPSALAIIPTADVVEKHQFIPDVVFYYDPTQPLTVANTLTMETEVGLGDGWEFGYDFPASAPAAGVFNVKKALHTTKRTQWAFGLVNIPATRTPWAGAQPYFITSTTTNSETSRFHAGLMWAGEPELLLGFDHMLGDDTGLWVDYATGQNGAGAISLDFAVTDHSNLTVGIVRNNGDGSWGIWTNAVWAINWD
jgi:hypothetical protein